MKKIIGMILLLSFLFTTAPSISQTAASEAETELPWMEFDEGLKKAEKEGKPVYLDFYALCPFCAIMDKFTYKDTSILNRSNDFIFIRIDGAENPELLEKYEIDMYPTMIFAMPDGSEMGRLRGNTSAVELSAEMDKAVNIFNDHYDPSKKDAPAHDTNKSEKTGIIDDRFFMIFISVIAIAGIIAGLFVILLKRKKN